MGTHELLPVLVVATLVWGAVFALPRQLEPLLADRLPNSPRRVRLVLAMFLLGLVLGLPLSGLAVDEWGAAWGLVGGPVCLALAFGLLAIEPRLADNLSSHARASGRLALLLLALPGLGFGTAWLACATIVLMPAANGIWPDHPGAALNIGFAGVALGTLLAPFLAKPLGNPALVGRTLWILALLCLVPAFTAVATPTGDWPLGKQVNVDPVLADPVVWLTAGALILCGMVTVGMQRWLELHRSKPTAFWVFWGPFLGGRLLVVPLLTLAGFANGNESWYAVFLGLTAAVALGQLAGTAETDRLPGSLGPLGFALGPLVPTVAAVVLLRFPNIPGVAVGITLAGGYLGEEALQPLARWFVGLIAGWQKIQVPLITTLLLVAVLLTLGLVQIREDRRGPRPPLPFRVPEIHLPRLPHFHLFPLPGHRPTHPDPADDAGTEQE